MGPNQDISRRLDFLESCIYELKYRCVDINSIDLQAVNDSYSNVDPIIVLQAKSLGGGTYTKTVRLNQYENQEMWRRIYDDIQSIQILTKERLTIIVNKLKDLDTKYHNNALKKELDSILEDINSLDKA